MTKKTKAQQGRKTGKNSQSKIIDSKSRAEGKQPATKCARMMKMIGMILLFVGLGAASTAHAHHDGMLPAQLLIAICVVITGLVLMQKGITGQRKS